MRSALVLQVIFFLASPILLCTKGFVNQKVKRLNRFTAVKRDENLIPGDDRSRMRSKFFKSSVLLPLGIVSSPHIAKAFNTESLSDPVYKKGLLNPPSDDFWYPPYLIGKWNTTLTFEDATFTEKIPLDILSKDNNLPGFTKYSIVFAPDMGLNVNLLRRYAQIDSHPREDHPFNMREIFRAFLPDDVKIESAAYSFQKAPDWFHSPANHWKIIYEDSTGRGIFDLETQKREINVLPGAVETIEFFRQKHTRFDGGDNPKSYISYSDYAIRWRISVPASSRDEFITVENLRRSTELTGRLDIFAYLQPTNDLYFKVPAIPAGRFSYNVSMRRILDNNDNTEYPFVWRNDGPVELQKYFLY